MVSGSNLRRIEPLRKHIQLRALDGLVRPNSHLLFGRMWLLLWSAVAAPLPKQDGSQRGKSHACGCPTYGQWAKSSVTTGEPGGVTPTGIDSAGVEDHPWGGAAVVLRGRESLPHGKGRQG
jgi:hypothetical protein